MTFMKASVTSSKRHAAVRGDRVLDAAGRPDAERQGASRTRRTLPEARRRRLRDRAAAVSGSCVAGAGRGGSAKPGASGPKATARPAAAAGAAGLGARANSRWFMSAHRGRRKPQQLDRDVVDRGRLRGPECEPQRRERSRVTVSLRARPAAERLLGQSSGGSRHADMNVAEARGALRARRA